MSALCAALACFEVDLVAIERPDGLLVDRLLKSGVQVLALHPNQVKAARDRFRAQAASPTGLTASCCASSRGPTAIVSESWSPTQIRPRRCGR